MLSNLHDPDLLDILGLPIDHGLLVGREHLTAEQAVEALSGHRLRSLWKKRRKPKRSDMRRKGDIRLYPQLTEAKISELFTSYVQFPNLSRIAKENSIPLKALKNVWKDQEWEVRRITILEKARNNTDYELQNAVQESISLIKAMKEKLREKIESMDASDIDTNELATQLERMVKTELLLLGGSTERRETRVTTHEERIRVLRLERGPASA